MDLPQDRLADLSARDRALWATLPDHFQHALLAGPLDGFRQGLRHLWLVTHHIDGRVLWLEGLRRAHQWVDHPAVLATWIADGDWAGMDALVAVLDSHRAGDLASTAAIDPLNADRLARAQALWNNACPLPGLDIAAGVAATLALYSAHR